MLRAGSALALMLVIVGCTPGGQFDPTEVVSGDIFNTKKKIAGDREPLFPEGVPGAQTGVPPDLVKGYQPPPEPAADNGTAAAKPVAAAEKSKSKPKPKPKMARAPAPSAPQMRRPAQAAWPNTPPQAPAAANWPNTPPQQPAATNWPNTPSQAPAATNWPAPPPPAGQAQQTAQPAQTNWPAPPAPSTYSR